MNLVFLSIMGGVAAASFTAFFNGERKTYFATFSGGFISWLVYSLMISFENSEIFSSFMSAVVVGLTAELF